MMATTAAVTTRMFIDGEWRDATTGATVRATSPATGESLGPVAEGDRADARLAIAAANAAFPSWGARTGFESAEFLHHAGAVVRHVALRVAVAERDREHAVLAFEARHRLDERARRLAARREALIHA